ncbi:hypothetical protein AB6D07_16570, partial [Vibrio sp. 10N.239.312.C11]|uniref:hypothetical protein n=2 Tax=Vibrio TaxID=662 RepID=UPI00354C0402
MTDMAISSYLGWLLLLIGCYPFCLVGVSMFFYDAERKQALRWLNGVSFLLAVFLLYMHMQTEVIYVICSSQTGHLAKRHFAF